MNIMTRFTSFLQECKRVFQITKKPSKTEYMAIVKVTSIGIAIIGVVGFIISIIAQMALK
ncbi:MAG: protein translocase SEC61 complex subunit gamma [Candidatus Nanoarchaeia archaeon]|nr:protein translocase SEC61 complex subunit gamma [Candidatus Nanoarchaeia archaeon]